MSESEAQPEFIVAALAVVNRMSFLTPAQQSDLWFTVRNGLHDHSSSHGMHFSWLEDDLKGMTRGGEMLSTESIAFEAVINFIASLEVAETKDDPLAASHLSALFAAPDAISLAQICLLISMDSVKETAH